MPLVKKEKQVTVEVSDLTIELDEKLTAQLESASASEKVTPEDYVLGILTEHFSPKKPTGDGADTTNAPTGNTDKKKSGSSKDKPNNLFEQLKQQGDKGKRVATELITFINAHEGMDNKEREKLVKRFQSVIDNEALRGVVPAIPQEIVAKATERLNIPADEDPDEGLHDESDLSKESLRHK